MAVDRDLAVADLAQAARVLPGHPRGVLALLGEAGVVEDQDGVALGGQGQQPPDALAVEVVVVPGHAGQQPLQGLLGGAGDDLGDGVAVLVGVLGQEPGQVALQGAARLGALEVGAERRQEGSQLGHRRGRRMRHAGRCALHTPLDAPTAAQVTKSY